MVTKHCSNEWTGNQTRHPRMTQSSGTGLTWTSRITFQTSNPRTSGVNDLTVCLDKPASSPWSILQLLSSNLWCLVSSLRIFQYLKHWAQVIMVLHAILPLFTFLPQWTGQVCNSVYDQLLCQQMQSPILYTWALTALVWDKCRCVPAAPRKQYKKFIVIFLPYTDVRMLNLFFRIVCHAITLSFNY